MEIIECLFAGKILWEFDKHLAKVKKRKKVV